MTAVATGPSALPRSRSTEGVVRTVAVLLVLLTVFAWDRSVLAVSLPEIKNALRLNPHQVGLIATIFTAGVALIAAPAGLIVRRIGFRAALMGGALVFSAATAYPPFAHGFGDLLASRVLVGLGEGVFHVTLLIYLAGLSLRHRAALIGLAATVYGLGAATGPSTLTLFNAAAGDWRWSFYGLAAVGVLLCLPLTTMSRTGAATPAVEQATGSDGRSVTWARLGRDYWPLLLLAGVQGMALYSVVGLLPTWTRANFGFSPAAAALALGAVGVGAMIGGAPMGLLADRLPRGPYLVVAGCVSAVAAILLMAFNLGPALAIGLALVFGAAAQTLYVSALAMAQERATAAAAPLVGLIVTIFYGAASFSGLVLIRVSERFGHQLGAIITYAVLYGCGILAFAAFQHRMPKPVGETVGES